MSSYLLFRIQRKWRAYKSHSSIHNSQPRASQQTCSPTVIMNGSKGETSPDSTSGPVLDNGTAVSDRSPQIQPNQSFDFLDTNMASVREHLSPSSQLSREYANARTHVPISPRRNFSVENKYKLCFTSDLSESSGEEQETGVTNTQTSVNSTLWNGHQLSTGLEVHDTSDRDTGAQVKRGDSYLFLETQLKDFVLTTDDMLFSEEFEEDGCANSQVPSGIDSLSDSLTLKEDDSSLCSIKSPLPSNGSSLTVAHVQCHSNSPLHLMTVLELKDLLKLLKEKMKGRLLLTCSRMPQLPIVTMHACYT